MSDEPALRGELILAPSMRHAHEGLAPNTEGHVARAHDGDIEPESALFALDGWRIDVAGAIITIDGRPTSRHVLRDLWTRLGVVLGEADRNVHLDAWRELTATLDAEYAYAMPASGKVREPGDGPSSKPVYRRVGGMIFRCFGRSLAAFRIGTHTVAMLHPHPKRPEWWEGPVLEFWPGAMNPQSRMTALRVRVATETVGAAPVADRYLGRPTPPPRPRYSLPAAPARGTPAKAPRCRGGS